MSRVPSVTSFAADGASLLISHISRRLRNPITCISAEPVVCSRLLSIRFVRVVDLVSDSRAQQQSSVARLGAGPDNGSFAQVTISASVDV